MVKRLGVLFICMIILTSCSTFRSDQTSQEVSEQNQEIEEKVKKEQYSGKEAQKDNNLDQWYGQWIGEKSTYYTSSELNIKPLSDNLVEFELTAFSGCHTGYYKDTVNIENEKAVHKTRDNIEFIFKLDERGRIQLQSNDYTYYCGYGVKFDSVYVKELKIKPPTAIKVGIVDTNEQEKIFKTLTGDMYDTFIDYAQYYFEEDNDYRGYRLRTFGLRGYSNAAVVMLNNKKNYIIAAVDSSSGVYYYTNDENYKKKPPEFIKEWLGDRKIINPKVNS